MEHLLDSIPIYCGDESPNLKIHNINEKTRLVIWTEPDQRHITVSVQARKNKSKLWSVASTFMLPTTPIDQFKCFSELIEAAQRVLTLYNVEYIRASNPEHPLAVLQDSLQKVRR